ncbi:MAG: trypsin-like peptidase domain-containing protein, partial [Anaerolineae bacterium]|nr:trypsin-like peptidase domain-containing protein [Anaerolineae bacterium]
PVSNAIIESAPQPIAASENNQATAQSAPVVVDESDSVAAVETVLPAVVTVLNRRGNFGGGSGSGVFVSETGYVVTNNHVVEGATELSVVYAQGGTAPARLVGTSPDFDIAVIKVEGPVPAVAQWGDSSELPLGGHVIAIGSALGRYQNTVTAGILSGFNRELGGLQALLQTDAAINSGNSGGPLINLAGQIVGINTAVVRGGGSGAAEGLGFAIPSNVARNVARQLIESGEARPAFLGIQYQPLNPQLVSEAGLSLSQGAMLSEVVRGTPAAQAGLQAGDIIVAINGKAIDDRNPLVSLLLEHVAGESITLDVVRDGQTLQTELVLGERA